MHFRFLTKSPFLIFPLFLLVAEIAAQKFSPFTSPYFFLLVDKNPVGLLGQILITTSRSIACYLLISTLLSLVFRPKYHLLMLAVFYLTAMLFLFRAIPSLREPFVPYYLRALAVVLGGAIFIFYRHLKAEYEIVARKRVAISGGLLVFLFCSSSNPWQISSPFVKAGGEPKPAILLLSFDAIPGDYFSFQDELGMVTPLWRSEWESKALSFPNAYSASNSTFTSWISILSGEYPHQSGVKALYPSIREGNLAVHNLLPNRLKAQGYETLFMTDCATTSYMKSEYGFRGLFQPDQGAFGSTRAILFATHPLPALLGWIPGGTTFFPELLSAASVLYRPELFFKEVEKTLSSAQNPSTLLIVHSCLSHRDVVRHVPASLEANLPLPPSPPSDSLRELISTLRQVDYFANQTFLSFDRAYPNSWKILLSDHGVRVTWEEDKLKYFSHALGPPLTRFQYNVPLFLVPPRELALPRSLSTAVSLIDLFPTLLKIAGEEVAGGESHNLLAPLPQSRSLWLSSTLPEAEPGENSEEFFQHFKNGTLDSSGEFFFSSSYSPDSTGLALLEFPFRLVRQKNGWEMYHDQQDPYHRWPLESDEKKRKMISRWELLSERIKKRGEFVQKIESVTNQKF